jgi:hypothetical protein
MVLGSLALVGAASAGELRVATDFPGGAAEVLGVDHASRRIRIAPPVRAGRGWPCWWYLCVEGAAAGEPLTLQVDRAAEGYRPGQRLTANWSLPLRAAVSTDNIQWDHTPPGKISAENGEYAITAPAAKFWLAWGPPFLPSHAEALLASTADKLAGSQRFILAETREGRPVQGIRLGGADKPIAIWVHARQHAWESGGSWVGRGFLEWIAGDDPAAAALRDSAEITFIPIMDVDNVTLGAGGKESLPQDHNRDWSDEPVYPEVAAAQRELRSRMEAGRLRVYVDLHNPGPGDKQPFYFGPFNYETLEPRRRQAFDRFLALSIEHIRDPLPILPQYRFATYVRTDEERGRMSSEWVRRRIGEDGIALTLETSWNTPHSNAEGYRAVGAGLGRAIAAFCASPP